VCSRVADMRGSGSGGARHPRTDAPAREVRLAESPGFAGEQPERPFDHAHGGSMTGRFEFDGDAVLELLEDSRGARERLLTEAQRFLAAGVDLHAERVEWDEDLETPEAGAPPGLWLRNDRGVYLQSNARDADPERIVHAHGFRAEVPFGDEPVCEFVDADTLAPLRRGDTLVLTLVQDKIRLSVVRDS
jgi:hypothetical protein